MGKQREGLGRGEVEGVSGHGHEERHLFAPDATEAVQPPREKAAPRPNERPLGRSASKGPLC
eukprot:2444570-Pyramimonas_sp.AAC.1